jgi:hypothetical protein
LPRDIRLQALADLLEDDVADRVAVGVVDRLEAVEVDEQQRQPAGIGVGLGRGGGEAVLEVDARRQLRQAVDHGRRADGAPRRLVVAAGDPVERLQHRRRDADQRCDEQRFGPGRWRRRIGFGRDRRRQGQEERAEQRARDPHRQELLARLELEAETDQRRGEEEDRDPRSPRSEDDGRAEESRRREDRMPIGHEKGHRGEAGECGHGLSRCRHRGGEGEAGEHPGERAGDEGAAERAAAGGVDRGEEVARPPEPEAAEGDRAGLEVARRRPAARSRRGEGLGGEPEENRADREADHPRQQPLAIQEIHEPKGPLMRKGGE